MSSKPENTIWSVILVTGYLVLTVANWKHGCPIPNMYIVNQDLVLAGVVMLSCCTASFFWSLSACACIPCLGHAHYEKRVAWFSIYACCSLPIVFVLHLSCTIIQAFLKEVHKNFIYLLVIYLSSLLDRLLCPSNHLERSMCSAILQWCSW